MLSDFKKIVKNNESNIMLTISIILVSLMVSGIILLISFSEDRGEIIFENSSASIFNNNTIKETSDENKVFVGSINSNKYHWPDCPFAKRISEENKVWFSTEEEAEKSGYIKCGNFEKYAPN